jgi:hypothetical protein
MTIPLAAHLQNLFQILKAKGVWGTILNATSLWQNRHLNILFVGFWEIPQGVTVQQQTSGLLLNARGFVPQDVGRTGVKQNKPVACFLAPVETNRTKPTGSRRLR